jgi:hypothetical protein
MITYRDYLLSESMDASKAYQKAMWEKRRIPELEKVIAKDPHYAVLYAIEILHGERFPEAEHFIVKDPENAFFYVREILHKRWPEAEPYIRLDGKYAPLYARDIIGKRWPEIEDDILYGGDLDTIYDYAKNCVYGAWPEAEPLIAKDAKKSYQYAKFVLRHRFPMGEKAIWKNSNMWSIYRNYLAVNASDYSNEEKMRWLREEGITEQLLSVLNAVKMSKTAQEYIIKRRPDLVGQIDNLDPELVEKYQHEKELGTVDL